MKKKGRVTIVPTRQEGFKCLFYRGVVPNGWNGGMVNPDLFSKKHTSPRVHDILQIFVETRDGSSKVIVG